MQPIHCLGSTLRLAASAGSDVSHGRASKYRATVVPRVGRLIRPVSHRYQPPSSAMGNYVTMLRFCADTPSIHQINRCITDALSRCTDDAVSNVAGACYSRNLAWVGAREGYDVVCRLR
ncbi:hypothetical protein BDV11DRAFT_196702 [Aspergillus similis]